MACVAQATRTRGAFASWAKNPAGLRQAMKVGDLCLAARFREKEIFRGGYFSKLRPFREQDTRGDRTWASVLGETWTSLSSAATQNSDTAEQSRYNKKRQPGRRSTMRPNVESPNLESPRAESLRAESLRGESLRGESLRGESLRGESTRRHLCRPSRAAHQACFRFLARGGGD